MGDKDQFIDEVLRLMQGISEDDEAIQFLGKLISEPYGDVIQMAANDVLLTRLEQVVSLLHQIYPDRKPLDLVERLPDEGDPWEFFQRAFALNISHEIAKEVGLLETFRKSFEHPQFQIALKSVAHHFLDQSKFHQPHAECSSKERWLHGFLENLPVEETRKELPNFGDFMKERMEDGDVELIGRLGKSYQKPKPFQNMELAHPLEQMNKPKTPIEWLRMNWLGRMLWMLKPGDIASVASVAIKTDRWADFSDYKLQDIDWATIASDHSKPSKRELYRLAKPVFAAKDGQLASTHRLWAEYLKKDKKNREIGKSGSPDPSR